MSRLRRPEDYQLSPAVFASLDARWGPHSIDRFAAAHNDLLPAWNSELHEPGSAGVNAFAQPDWRSHRNWCHPPVRLLPQLAQHLQRTGAAATVLAPHWPAQPWFAPLAALASDTVLLPAGASLSIGSGVVNFNDFAFTALGGFGAGTYTLFNSTAPITGTLGSSLTGAIGAFNATLGLGDGGNDIVLNVVPVPEPTALGTGLLAGFGFLLRRRRRSRA